MNQPFNVYKIGLDDDLAILKDYCINQGRLMQMNRRDLLAKCGEASQWIGYIMKGCFKYIVHNDVEHKDFITGFAFEGELVSDFPCCLDEDVSEVSIVADIACELYVISGEELQALFDRDLEMTKMNVNILKNLFKMVYSRFLDQYRLDARGRYVRLLNRCPQVVQILSLKDIASFLNVHPNTISRIRREITFENKDYNEPA